MIDAWPRAAVLLAAAAVAGCEAGELSLPGLGLGGVRADAYPAQRAACVGAVRGTTRSVDVRIQVARLAEGSAPDAPVVAFDLLVGPDGALWGCTADGEGATRDVGPILPAGAEADAEVSDETAPEPVASDRAAPDRAAPDRAAPDDTAPDEVAEDRAEPDEADAAQAAPDEAASGQVGPDEADAEQAAQDNTAPDEVATDAPAPDEAAADQAAPDETDAGETDAGETEPDQDASDEDAAPPEGSAG